MNDVISVIVPVYNVEKYLNKCIESIVGQTYKNLEIILVDDGSPDRCPQMCDEWARKDDRIKVIHKKNGGISSARNCGLKASTGDYINFIDSDDYIEPTMYEELLHSLKESNASMSMCGMSKIRNGDIIQVCNYNNKIMSSEEYLSNAFKINNTGKVGLKSFLNKLFLKKLFLDINDELFLFNENIYYGEDILMLVCIFKPKMNIAICDRALYNYVMVNSGASHNNINIRKISVINAMDLIVSLCEQKFPSLNNEARSYSCGTKATILVELKMSSLENKNKYIPKLESYVKENFKYCKIKAKLRVLFALYFPNIYIFLKNIKVKLSG